MVAPTCWRRQSWGRRRCCQHDRPAIARMPPSSHTLAATHPQRVFASHACKPKARAGGLFPTYTHCMWISGIAVHCRATRLRPLAEARQVQRAHPEWSGKVTSSGPVSRASVLVTHAGPIRNRRSPWFRVTRSTPRASHSLADSEENSLNHGRRTEKSGALWRTEYAPVGRWVNELNLERGKEQHCSWRVTTQVHTGFQLGRSICVRQPSQ
jgi:hypothetical protein